MQAAPVGLWMRKPAVSSGFSRARPGSDGHESRAKRRNRAKTSDRPWTPVPALVFPQCSLVVRSLDTTPAEAHALAALGLYGDEPQPAYARTLEAAAAAD
jgi:hypothetical protein